MFSSGFVSLVLLQDDAQEDAVYVLRSTMRKILRRSLSSSFGSACMGGLRSGLVLFFWSTRLALRHVRLFPILDRALTKVVTKGMRIGNPFAFPRVALQGVGFSEAAITSWTMMLDAGVDAIAEQDASSRILHNVVLALSCLMTLFASK